MSVLFSVRMRAARGGAHEAGGRHISGAERLIAEDLVPAVLQSMFARARGHSRGCADFVNIVVEEVPADGIRKIPLLPVTTWATRDATDGRNRAVACLTACGVSNVAAQRALTMLEELPDSMRGAMLLDKTTGRRVDRFDSRGVRVSRMDLDHNHRKSFQAALEARGLNNPHVREAMVLASKVAGAPGVAAEVCWSDDPDYTAGYVASPAGYFRFTHLKPVGSGIGGRVFFVDPSYDIDGIIAYLEKQPVLVYMGPDWRITEAGV